MEHGHVYEFGVRNTVDGQIGTFAFARVGVNSEGFDSDLKPTIPSEVSECLNNVVVADHGSTLA